MKKYLALALLMIVLCRGASAGVLSGNSMPFVEKTGDFAFKIGSSIVMFYTPFSSYDFAGKYAFSDSMSIYAKYGKGMIDYTTIKGIKLSNQPLITTAGLEYFLSGSRATEYTAFVAEYETASWSINKKSNISTEIQLAIDFGVPSGSALKTRYRFSLNNFNAGTESNEKISTSLKYGMSTEIEYRIHPNFTGSLDGGLYVGDTTGLIAYFGVGIGYNP